MYKYLCRMRPPMPGAVPRDGLKEVRDLTEDEAAAGGWGVVVYSRKLTREELEHYDLAPIYDAEGSWPHDNTGSA